MRVRGIRQRAGDHEASNGEHKAIDAENVLEEWAHHRLAPLLLRGRGRGRS